MHCEYFSSRQLQHNQKCPASPRAKSLGNHLAIELAVLVMPQAITQQSPCGIATTCDFLCSQKILPESSAWPDGHKYMTRTVQAFHENAQVEHFFRSEYQL